MQEAQADCKVLALCLHFYVWWQLFATFTNLSVSDYSLSQPHCLERGWLSPGKLCIHLVIERSHPEIEGVHTQSPGDQLVPTTYSCQSPNVKKVNTITGQPQIFPSCKAVVFLFLQGDPTPWDHPESYGPTTLWFKSSWFKVGLFIYSSTKTQLQSSCGNLYDNKWLLMTKHFGTVGRRNSLLTGKKLRNRLREGQGKEKVKRKKRV